MDVMQLASDLISKQLGLTVDAQTLTNAISALLGSGDGSIDLAGLASKMASNGEVADILGSWLGDGANSPISADNILGILGEGKVAEFASTVGTDTPSAAAGLADVLPQLVDQASSGGNLLEAAGGLGGLLGAAKSFLK